MKRVNIFIAILTLNDSMFVAFEYLCYQGSHPTWKTWNFVIFFSRAGKCLEFAQKVVKTWKNLEICKIYVSCFTFQDVIYKNNSDLLLCHIYIINTNPDSKAN